jgi:tellurite resistance protein TehA-like permease
MAAILSPATTRLQRNKKDLQHCPTKTVEGNIFASEQDHVFTRPKSTDGQSLPIQEVANREILSEAKRIEGDKQALSSGTIQEETNTTVGLQARLANNNSEDSFHSESFDHRLKTTAYSPVLLRMPNTAFGISLGLAGNAIMWKVAGGARFLTALIDTTIILLTYLYKLIFHFPLVEREYKHPVRAHFMNGPHLTLLLVSLAIPSHLSPSTTCLQALFATGLFFQIVVTQYIYEHLMFSSERNFTQAKPQFFLSIIGWFLLTVLGQQADVEVVWGIAIPSFCFGTGIFMYVIVTVNVFNGLHRNMSQGSPALFLLFAPPSVAAVAIDGFDKEVDAFSVLAQVFLGWALVLLLMLIRLCPRIADKPASLGVYWAYVFPMASLAAACLRYAIMAGTIATEIVATITMVLATTALFVVFVRMVYHSFLCLQSKAKWGDPLLEIDPEMTRAEVSKQAQGEVDEEAP